MTNGSHKERHCGRHRPILRVFAKLQVDGEVLLGDLARAGFDIVDAGDDADCIVVNTCAFVEDAKSESLNAVFAAAERKAASKVQYNAFSLHARGTGWPLSLCGLFAVLVCDPHISPMQGMKLVLTGCLAQRYSAELAEQIPEADLVVGFERYGELPSAIRESLGLDPGGPLVHSLSRSWTDVLVLPVVPCAPCYLRVRPLCAGCQGQSVAERLG